jgi:hypothetical protein
VKRENTLYAFSAYNPSYGKFLVYSGAFAGYYCSAENLSTHLFAFLNPAMHVYYITDFEIRDILFQGFTFNTL